MRKSTPFENSGLDFRRVLNEIQAKVLVMSAGSELTRWLLCGRLNVPSESYCPGISRE